MAFTKIECSPQVEEKLASKHGVELSELEEALQGQPQVRKHRDGLYNILGRTDAGRYLFILVRPLSTTRAKLVTARDMDAGERRTYRRG